MAWSWSDPSQGSQGGQTLPELQSKVQIQSPNISGLISSILEQRYRAEQQRRQDMAQLIAGVGSVAGGLVKGYQKSQADDAANAAIYGMQYPNDPFGGYTNPDKVPDYGGTDALSGATLDTQLRQKQIEDQMKAAGVASLIGQRTAKTAMFSSGQPTPGRDVYDSETGTYVTPAQEEAFRNQRVAIANQAVEDKGLPGDVASNPNSTLIHDEAHGGFPTAVKDLYGAIPEGYYGIDMGTTPGKGGNPASVNPPQYVTRAYLEAARAAAAQAEQAKAQLTAPMVRGSNVRGANPSGPPVGTPGTVPDPKTGESVKAHWDGFHWIADE